MNTSAPQASAPRHHGAPQRHQRTERSRRPQEPLSDDQYVATSLALVADLSQRVRRGGAHRHG